MNSKPLSSRTCLLLILLFGVLAYSNTFDVPFYFDDQMRIVENLSLRPPINLGRIWESFPTRFVANLSFALQYVLTGLAPWGFHLINLLIHLLVSLTVFGTTRLLLSTPALKDTLSASHRDLFALGTALLFVTHPIQTQAVTYVVQRMTSLATLFYLATLWMYLKARIENARYYPAVFLSMLAAMFTKEIGFTLPFAILLVEWFFFPLSEKETFAKKVLRWLPFAAFLLVVPLTWIIYKDNLVRIGGAMNLLPTWNTHISRWDFLLTEFRVMRTYLRLLFFPAGQCLDYDYRMSAAWGDPDAWAAFSLLVSLLVLSFLFFKKYRLLSFGILWFFLTLSVESSLIPYPDVIFEHRLYLPMFGFSLFVASFLWLLTKSSRGFLAAILILAVVLSGMTYARNELWKDPFVFWRDNIRKSPFKYRSYMLLGEAYSKERKDEKTALLYYQKALETGRQTPRLLANMSNAYSALGNSEMSKRYLQEVLFLQQPTKESSQGLFFYNEAISFIKEGKISRAIQSLEKATHDNPQYPFYYIQLGELYRETGREDEAISCFRKAIAVSPSSKEGYDALALLYKEKGDKEKALAVLVEYLKLKKEHAPLWGN
ncbi:MAG: tetratricopeptide repeat protein [Candidatus Omnitrophota bacterium]